jgi:hypothetical protein
MDIKLIWVFLFFLIHMLLGDLDRFQLNYFCGKSLGTFFAARLKFK